MKAKNLKSLSTAAIVGLCALSTAAHAQLVSRGTSFRFTFDLRAATLPAPYDEFQALIQFDPSDYFGLGDGFTAQLFDLSGNALGNTSSILWTDPTWDDAFNMAFSIPLFAPMTAEDGYILFSNVQGSFVLAEYQYVIGMRHEETSGRSTGYLPASVQVFAPVPERSAYGLIGCAVASIGVLTRVLARRRSQQKSDSAELAAGNGHIER